jgi:hypothetical protein
MNRVQLISLFSLQLRKDFREQAKETLDMFFKKYIVKQKVILLKSIDP